MARIPDSAAASAWAITEAVGISEASRVAAEIRFCFMLHLLLDI
jgi:hypothetical protein